MICEKDREIILELFFDKVKDIDEIVKYFNNKYSYIQIKGVINKKYMQYGA